MRKHIDAYGLHKSGKFIRYTVRIRVIMKDDVDAEVLRKSINVAIKRYPYFRKEMIIDSFGGYDLIDNNRDIKVIETRDNLPKLGSDEINKHLFYVDYNGKDINFNISHSLAGGKGISPLVETCLYEYVTEKYNVKLNSPNIIKSNSELLDGEDDNIDIEHFNTENRIYLKNRYPTYILTFEYLRAMFDHNKSNRQYYILSFNQEDILKYAKGNDSSIASAFTIFIFKALCKVLPPSAKIISACIAHNPVADFGYPNTHSNILSGITIKFKRSMKDYDEEKLGAIARGQIYLQSEKEFVSNIVYRNLKNFSKLDKMKSYFSYRLWSSLFCSVYTEGAVGTYFVNYAGKRDYGDLANYIDTYSCIVDGHVMSEITSMSNKLFLTFHQLNKNTKYINAIKEVFKEYNIPFTIKGPFITNNVEVELPKI